MRNQPLHKKGLYTVIFLFAGFHIQSCSYSDSAPLKPTKSALKKAAKIARIEKQQQQKAAKMSDHSQEESSSSGSPRRPPATFEPAKVVHESYEIKPVAEDSNDTPQSAPDETTPQATLQPPVVQADYNFSHHDDVISNAEQSYPTSMEPSGRNSPELLVRSADETILQAGVVGGDVQLELKTKQEAERTKTKQNAVTRTIWGFAMIGGFIGAPQIIHSYDP